MSEFDNLEDAILDDDVDAIEAIEPGYFGRRKRVSAKPAAMTSTGGDADYRKLNDRGNNSSTYHKKDGTPVRAKLKNEAGQEVKAVLSKEGLTTPDVIALAKRHLGEGDMASSAKQCYDDAVLLMAKGKEGFAYQRALRSLSYSVGVFHADYKRAEL